MNLHRCVLVLLGLSLLVWPADALAKGKAKTPKGPPPSIEKGDGYLIEIAYPQATPAGGEIAFAVRPAKGLKINEEPGAPFELLVIPPKGISPKSNRLGREAAKLKPQELRFLLPYTREEAVGDRLPMPFELAFPLCSSGSCFIRRHKGQLSIPKGEFPPLKPQKATKPKKPETPKAQKTPPLTKAVAH